MRSVGLSVLTLAVFTAASLAGGDRHRISAGEKPAKAARHAAGAIDPRTYRSPGTWHKLMVDRGAIPEADCVLEAEEYGSATLFVVPQHVLERIETLTLVEEQRSKGAEEQAGIADSDSSLPLGSSALLRGFEVRDDYNALLLRSGIIDTTAGDAPGMLFGLGGSFVADAGQATGSRAGDKPSIRRLRIVQFVGPVKRAWLDELRHLGLEIIAYLPNNAYLVRGSGDAGQRITSAAMGSYSRGDGFIQWEGPFLDRYKIHPALSEKVSQGLDDEISIAIQVARSFSPGELAPDQDLRAARQMASALLVDTYTVGGFANLKMRIRAAKIAELAALENVVNIEPWIPPQLYDERADQIDAGAVTSDGKQASGPGYMNWLQSIGFNSRFDFAIDVTDSGLDRGSTSASMLHPDFVDSSGSRVTYTRDYTSELDPGDVDGHGTINASIAAGSSFSSAAGMQDSAGFNYGLGVAPFAMIGASKIFQSSGRFDLVDPFSMLVADAYRDGARVSSNSWGASSNFYNIDSQEYDLRVRDALPQQPGNQEMSICFAAGNGGPIPSIGSPGTAKNVISVAAGENFRKEGVDGCGLGNEDADNALDIAFFSSTGPVEDGRMKPDITAPGTHIQGAASQNPAYDGSGVCGGTPNDPYFPKDQKLYTWSSGTSHSTPQVAGAAALVRQFFINRGEEPSAALIKALLLNTTTYMNGEFAGGDLPHPRQGWGLINLGRAFDGAPKIFVNQARTFSDTGQEFVMTGEVRDISRPLRVTLVWTDAPGFSGFAPWVNDLSLEVTINGEVYRGNNFVGDVSQPGGAPNTRDNVEAVWLPAGTVGTFVIRVRATNIAGDGVTGNTDLTDQDFALVVYNAERKDAPVATLNQVLVSGGADATIDPGESVSIRISIADAAPAALIAARGTLTSSTAGVTVTSGLADFPTITSGQAGEAQTPFSFTVDRSVACGAGLQFQLDVSSPGALSRIKFALRVGSVQSAVIFADDVESGEAKWTHASGIKKKKLRTDTWSISTKRRRSGASSWFSSDLDKVTDAHLDTLPVALPSDVRNLQLVFYHTFEFESVFDGGVLEISTGEDFTDLGDKIILGRYTGRVSEFFGNPLGTRSAWIGGRLGTFRQVVVDLSSFAGKTVVIRFRIGTDSSGSGLGWYIDDVSLQGERVSCTG